MGKADPEKHRLFDVLGLTEDDGLLTDTDLEGAYLTLRLQQSWVEGDTNEYTADGFLNEVFDRNTGGEIGFTDDAAGEDWRKFMDRNMLTWIRNAVVYSALRENSNLPFFLEHNRIRGFVGMATVGDYPDGVVVRTVPSTAGRESTAAGELMSGDEVAVIGQGVGRIGDDPDGFWTAVIFNGRKRWVASFLLESPENVSPPEDEWLDFEGGFSRAKDWQFYFDLLRHLDTGTGNAN